jgi:hypothetical protein
MTKNEMANVIEAFINGQSGEWDWDEFISLKLSDPDLDAVRKLCSSLPEIDPSTDHRHYCGERGMEIMIRLVNDLRAGNSLTPISHYIE